MLPLVNVESLSDFKKFLSGKYLWSSYVLIIFVLATLLLISIFFARNALQVSAARQTRLLALAMDEVNRRQFENLEISLDYVFARIEEKGGLQETSKNELDAFLGQALELDREGGVHSIFILNRKGEILNSTPRASSEQIIQHYSESRELQFLRNQKNHSLLTMTRVAADDKKLIVMNRVLRAKDGRFEGVVGIAQAYENLEDRYKALALPPGVSFTLFRDDGKVIYHYPEEQVYEGSKISLPPHVLMGTEGFVNGAIDLDKSKKIGYFISLPSRGTVSYAGYSNEAVFSDWKNVTILLLTIFFVLMAVLLTLIRLLNRSHQSLQKTLERHAYCERAINRIQEKTEMLTGDEFLRSLGLEIAAELDVENAIIGVLLPQQPKLARLILNFANGSVEENYTYDLSHTPFDKLQPGELFVHPRASSKIFDKDPMLGDRDIESSMGMLLKNNEQRPIGIFMIYSERQIRDLTFTRTVLSVFAARIAVELERVRTDETRKEVERLRKQIEERSAQSEKLEAIGKLAEGIVHDFNNILTIILASTEKMLGTIKQGDQETQYLDAIKRAAHRARHLVSQILVFSKKTDTDLKPIKLRDIFDKDAMSFLESALPKQIMLRLDLGGSGNYFVKADLNQIQQALLNLCVNAARALGPEGGEIRISLRSVILKDQRYVKWCVHYNGEKLEHDEIEKLFDPFYSQNVGMVIAQRIISNHQGFIEVKSTGEGTDFEVFLPVVNVEVLEETRMTPYHFKSAQKVMIVDDEPEIGQLIKELLENEGLQVEAFVDPLKALKVFTEMQNQYFLIISDLSMPGVSGVEFMRKVREMNKTIPLILWSGYHHFLDEELIDMNVKVLSKPVDVQKLLSIINTELSQLGAQGISKEVRAPDIEPSKLT